MLFSEVYHPVFAFQHKSLVSVASLGFADIWNIHTSLFRRQATIGPTAVNSMMSFNYAGGSPHKAVTLAFFSGVIEILCGILDLGFLVQYISQPVVTAFSSAVSVQVK